MRILLFTILLFFSYFSFAQQPPATKAEDRLNALDQRHKLKENSLLSNIPFQSIGPTVFSGRVSDLAVSPTDPSHFYVAYASGGLYKTENNGTSFTPLFDKEAVITIGDIAVNWNENIIWVGTGEVNSSRSSYSGVGIFKSKDGGKTWSHAGLGESHHIGRIVLHPTNPDIAWVAVLGHLYSPNLQRGIYKTMDGGQTWQQKLFVNENAGAIDLIIDPDDPNILFAATWERTRRAWNFVESGAGSGIYKSTNGGDSWDLLSTPKSGFPTGEGIGRIGLALHKNDGNRTLYAILDNYNRRPKEDTETPSDALTKDDFRTMNKSSFLGLEKEKLQAFLQANNFPKKYSAEQVTSLVKEDKIKPIALVEYLEDANSLLFDTPVIGAEIYRSDNDGKSWKKTHEGYLDFVYNSYGYYFGQILVSPHNVDKIYFMGVPIIRSTDGGKTFKSINGDNVHVDHHAIWANPNRDGHLILGNDGGVNISYDDGETWIKCNTPAVGQFYYIAVDMAKPYNVYGGLQDNGVWVGPNTYSQNTRWHGSGRYPYQSLLGGDGMQVAIDSRDNNTVYTGFQFGNYYRINKNSGRRDRITPKHELGERPYRWNWQAPIHLSDHNKDILYFGGNKLFRSFDKGDSFHAISGDLTNGGKEGDVAYGTLTCIHESPLQFGLIYTGSDDGLVYVTQDGGVSWTNINTGLPENMWVSRIQASQFDEATVYVTLNGYRWDHMESYVYASKNYGKNWEKIGTDLPKEPVNVIKEDPVNENILYVGTDHGLYVSLDKGNSFMLMDKELPAVPVHDVVIHPRDKDLLVGTHGRSIYKADAKHLQQLNNKIISSSLYVFDIPKLKYRSSWGRQFSSWSEPNEPSTKLPIFTNQDGNLSLTITSKDGLELYSKTFFVSKGIQYLEYDLTISERIHQDFEKEINNQEEQKPPITLKKADNGNFYIHPGKYTLTFEKDGEQIEKELTIEE